MDFDKKRFTFIILNRYFRNVREKKNTEIAVVFEYLKSILEIKEESSDKDNKT